MDCVLLSIHFGNPGDRYFSAGWEFMRKEAESVSWKGEGERVEGWGLEGTCFGTFLRAQTRFHLRMLAVFPLSAWLPCSALGSDGNICAALRLWNGKRKEEGPEPACEARGSAPAAMGCCAM